MDFNLLLSNLSNPAFLFFLLGVIAVQLRSDLEIPPNSSKFISLYLLFSIGFKGGQELSHSGLHQELFVSALFGVLLASLIPIYIFLIIKSKVGIDNAGAIAAAYGSVSAVTFVTGAAFLENQGLHFDGYMVAIMAMMEAPAIIWGVVMIRIYQRSSHQKNTLKEVIHHSLTNGSVILILGSLFIGFFANEEQAQGIKPFTTDLFKGFLAIFLLDMGIQSGRKLRDFAQSGWFYILIAIVFPLVNGCITAILSQFVTLNTGNRFMLAVLAASASYIAVPAAMKVAVPKANPGIYLPMALAITFPFNITLGMPLYLLLI